MAKTGSKGEGNEGSEVNVNQGICNQYVGDLVTASDRLHR